MSLRVYVLSVIQENSVTKLQINVSKVCMLHEKKEIETIYSLK